MSDVEQTYRVLITGLPIATEAAEILETRASFRITQSYPTSDKIATMAAEDNVDGLIVRQGKITRDVMAASPDLKVIVKHGVGVDNIDIEAATDLGIPVCITPNANYQSVAEHALSMMFALAKNLSLRGGRAGRLQPLSDQYEYDYGGQGHAQYVKEGKGDRGQQPHREDNLADDQDQGQPRQAHPKPVWAGPKRARRSPAQTFVAGPGQDTPKPQP